VCGLAQDQARNEPRTVGNFYIPPRSARSGKRTATTASIQLLVRTMACGARRRRSFQGGLWPKICLRNLTIAFSRFGTARRFCRPGQENNDIYDKGNLARSYASFSVITRALLVHSGGRFRTGLDVTTPEENLCATESVASFRTLVPSGEHMNKLLLQLAL